MGNNYQEPYDPRWNQFNKPYLDLFTHATIMTASARIDDPLGNNISVVSIDFVIANLINKLFAQNDKDETGTDFDTHSVLFHEDQNTVYYHRLWNANDRTIVQWQDLEFNKTNSPYTDNEYIYFTRLVQNSKDFSVTGQYNIDNQVNITPFYQYWTKNQQPYISLIYPIEIISPQNVWNKTMVTKQVLMIGQVRKDISGIFRVFNLTHNMYYTIIIAIQATLVIIFVLILTLYFAAYILYQVVIPLEKLTIFIQQNTDLFRFQNQIQKQNSKAQQTLATTKSQNQIFKKSTFQIKGKKIIKQSIFPKGNKSPQILKQQSMDLKLIQNKKDEMIDQTFSNLYYEKYPNSFFLNQKSFSINHSCIQSKQQDIQLENLDLSSLQNKTENEQEQCNGLYSFQNTQFNLKTNQDATNQSQQQQSKNMSSLSISKNKFQFQAFEQSQKVNLNQDIDPMFLEMQIIKDTFYQLQSLISFKNTNFQQQANIVDDNQLINCERGIIHYAFAYKLFKQLKNNFGVSLSSLNLGYFYYRKNYFREALIYYESAMIYSIIDMGFTDISQFTDSWKKGVNNIFKNQDEQNQKITIVCLSLILLSHTIKEAIIDRNDFNFSENASDSLFKKINSHQCWLKKAINYTEIVLDMIQHLSNKKQILFTDEMILVIQTSYIEMKIYQSPPQRIEELIYDLEQKLLTCKNDENEQYQEQYFNLFLTNILSSQKQEADVVSSSKKSQRESIKNNFEKLVLILKGKVEYFKGHNRYIYTKQFRNEQDTRQIQYHSPKINQKGL
ncbi:hypothetical protein ABPG74_017909 [Tetrahymena malaccensis]